MTGPVVTKSGRVLTDADFDAVADEFERGVDLSKWHFRPGRPYLDASSREHSPRIAVRLPAELHRRVREKATAEGRSISRVVRDLLEDYARQSSDSPSVDPERAPVTRAAKRYAGALRELAK